ncbi:hypothetical protein NQ318_003852 [Aromia moschata]|uniref:CUB domain-containing protein n=1 Tax=Aromia moschata TaxID=1265417 RepID=A0AAV8ZAF2_9CUCU|nr:hypothetical protein NQ318_003852 [Aromia moschata]
MRFLLVVFLVECAYGGFFDLTDVEDPLALLWNPRQPEQRLTECKAQTESGIKYGVCTPYSNCLLSRGRPNGIFENTCGKTSDTKVAYFEGSDVQTGATPCTYTVKLKNTNICQVRLDFVKFNLAPATLTTTSTHTPSYKCINDILRIQPNHYNIPDLCGNNDKQHVYVHVNQSDGVTKGVHLDITLADRLLNRYLPSPSWKIKVTQLECPGYRTGFDITSNDYIQDFPLLAPSGAIQYFTEPSGYIKSFGFDGSVARQSYTYGQKYAVAFQRGVKICGIKFIPEQIYLPHDGIRYYGDENCKHYLFVPDLSFDNSSPTVHNLKNRVCLTEVEEFRSYAPGPLFVHFNSMKSDFITDETLQQGFNIRYELLNRCP